ncbi:MAG: hypothetical protein AAFY63_15840, partial [Cyanobacteria bacterium J06643_13]
MFTSLFAVFLDLSLLTLRTIHVSEILFQIGDRKLNNHTSIQQCLTSTVVDRIREELNKKAMGQEAFNLFPNEQTLEEICEWS